MISERRAPLQADILAALDTGPMTAAEIACTVGTTYRNVLHALDALAAADHVVRVGWKRVRGRSQYLFARQTEIAA